MNERFPWSDAWLLTALAATGRPASLRDLVAAADGIDHAIPTTPEINGALGRLGAAGLVRRDGGLLAPTPAAAALFERARSGRRSLFDVAGDIHQALQRDVPPPPGAADAAGYTDAEVLAAYEQYRGGGA